MWGGLTGISPISSSSMRSSLETRSTCYQALAAGKPVIGLATNMDQFLNMAAVEDAGCGRLLRSSSCTVESVRAAVREAIEDNHLQARALEIMKCIAHYPAARIFADVLTHIIQR